MGKGSRPRPTDRKKFESNFNEIQWKSKKDKDKSENKSDNLGNYIMNTMGGSSDPYYPE